MTRLRGLRLAGALALTASLTLAACSSTTGPAMMGDGSPGGGMTNGFDGPMMRSVPRSYHLSRLICSAPSDLPGTTVRVILGDMGMTRMTAGTAPLGGHMMLRAIPARVPAGQVSFAVANLGWRTHELVVLPLPLGQQVGEREPGPDGRVDEIGSLGEASASCAEGSGEGIEAGRVGWVTLSLPAGRYELICNLRNHYANGMRQLFVVT